MRSLADEFLYATIADIGGTTAGEFSPVPDRGKLRKLSAVVNLQPTTNPAVITLVKNGSNQTPTLSIPTSLTATATAVSVDLDISVEEGDHLEIASDGGPANTPAAFFTLVLSRAEGGA